MSDPDGSQARASRLPHDAPHRDATQHMTLQRSAHDVATQRTTLQRSTPCYNAAHDVAAQPTSWMSDPTIASSVMAHSVYATTLGYLRPPRNPKGTDAATCVERSPGADDLTAAARAGDATRHVACNIIQRGVCRSAAGAKPGVAHRRRHISARFSPVTTPNRICTLRARTRDACAERCRHAV